MVKIITDSTCDLEIEKLNELGIEMIPLTVLFGDESFKDRIELSPSEFYSRLEASAELPTTSQVNPADFEDVFRKHIDNGDEVLGLFLSGNLSGTCQSARIAAETLGGDKISIVDSKQLTVGMTVLLLECVRLRDEGKTAKEIKIYIDEIKSKVRLIAMFSTLKYLCMGGRISKTAATFGTILGIYPMICVENGEGIVNVTGKVKGKKAAMKFIKDYFDANPVDETKAFAYGHTNSPEDLEVLKETMADSVQNKNIVTCNVGCVIGTHAGPGAVVIAYISK